MLYCKKKHRNFKTLIENLRRSFLFQVKNTCHLLSVDTEVDGYVELCRDLYKTRDLARDIMITQMNFIGQGISIVESDTSILDVPMGKDLIVRVLRNGFEQTRVQFLRDIDIDFQDLN